MINFSGWPAPEQRLLTVRTGSFRVTRFDSSRCSGEWLQSLIEKLPARRQASSLEQLST
jgi:hypothetical protein